jgi:heme A synthase
MLLSSAQSWVLLLLGLAALALEVWALIDVLRQRPDAFIAAGKRTKQFWTIVLVVAALLGFVTFRSPLNLFALVAVVAAAVYLTDVRPALRQVSGRGGTAGPYGPW